MAEQNIANGEVPVLVTHVHISGVILPDESTRPGCRELQFFPLNAHHDIHAGVKGGDIAFSNRIVREVVRNMDLIVDGIPTRNIIIGRVVVALVVTLFRTREVLGDKGAETGEDLPFGIDAVGIQQIDGKADRVYLQFGIGIAGYESALIDKTF